MVDPGTLTAFPELQKGIFDRFLIEPIYTFLQRRSARTRGILLFIVSTMLVLSAFWAMLTLNAYTHFMASTLAQRLEPTEQPYKGLEAYLLSGIDDSPRGRWESPGGEESVGALERLFASQGTNDLRKLAPPWMFHLNDSLAGNVRNQYITTHVSSAFLFQPAFVLQYINVSHSHGLTNEVVRRALPQNPVLQLELGAAMRAAATLKALDGESIDGLPIGQSYYMSDMGTLMIRKNTLGSLDSTYANAFRPSRFFAERPYFWKAIEKAKKRGAFDYITHPYIDHGGLGAVRTYVRALQLPSGRHAIIGMDCAIPTGEKSIIDKLRRIAPPLDQLRGRRPGIIIATKENGKMQFMAESGEVPGWVNDKMALFTATTAEVTGQITSDHDLNRPTRAEIFQFAVPVGGEEGLGGAATRIVVAEVDLEQMKNLWLPGIVCVVMSLLLGAMLHFFYQQHVAQRREQERVLNKVASIMRDAPTPFCWLDEHNQFRFANLSFITLLGYETLEDLKKHPCGFKRTFREMLDIQDQAAYDAILKRSAQEIPTDRYAVRVRTKAGRYLRVDVHGERMPFGGVWRNEGPHRFGVFLAWVEGDGRADGNAGPVAEARRV